MVWYGMDVRPYHTSCLCNYRYGILVRPGILPRLPRVRLKLKQEKRKCIIILDINHILIILAILDVVIFMFGLSIPGPETLARFYNICL
ncbi:hypothetical protein DM02DRAFT_372040 [Periconia macrospinosa]|uniref:Uncharacterized protein n=1 Tax=Periconia macrospinosa TaxID=97972 RepID=A0A2V1CZ97_9PLEO|nr:hypothetical protein DM02DRAFT_372040 [Periconia macrospinosa]